jgi:FHS family glucose/mannose:H+ symporter-like MFS transporter
MKSSTLPGLSSQNVAAPLPPRQIVSIHALFLMTGMGAMLLGPLLPSLATHWHLRDERSGLLIAAQFLGSFAGSTTLRVRLKSDLALACLVLVVGFAALASATTQPHGFFAGLAALVLIGFGCGRGITAINLIAASRIRRHRASALALLNLTWGVGAVLAPASVALFAATVRASGIAAGFAAVLTLLSLMLWRFIPEFDQPSGEAAASRPALAVSLAGLVYFGALFFFYGGLEASASNWLSLFTIRSIHGTLREGATVATFLWIGLTAGRAVASLLLLRLGERPVFSCGIVLAALGSLLLARVHSESLLIALAILIGIGLAPAFPALCSLLMASPRHPRHAGAVMAVSSLGGAFFPWLIGLVSQQTGSWRTGLSVPLGLAIALVLLIALFRSSEHSSQRV